MMRFLTGIFIVMCAIECPALTKIACIGNSITYGYGLSNPSSQSYPGKLQKLLGTSNFNVQNYGVSATTLSKKGDNPYWRNGQLPQVFAFQPDIITIKLGTNDTKPQNWENLGSGSQFKTDYLALIDTLAAMQSHPKIYLILPVPVFPNPTAVSWGIRDSIVQKQTPIIKEVATARSLPVIDANTPLKNFSQYFKVDGVHPDSSAEDTLAHIVYRALTAQNEVLIKPDDPNINYYGRFDFSNASTTVKFNWPGSVIEATFPGPSIGAELTDGGGYFNVEIDGVLVDSLKPSNVTHRTIRTNLSTTVNHTIRLIGRTSGATYTFGGFYLADGKVLAAKPVQPIRKIEFIGDSWTAGDVIGETDGMPYDWKYFNASLTYARLTSQAFHAQDRLIARGGAGMVKSNDNAPAIASRYPQTLCDVQENWNFDSWTPDLVVIFFGINDFYNGVTDAEFKTTYTSFINTVRGHYANVPVILIGLAGNVLNDVKSIAQTFTKVYTFSSPVTLANASAMSRHPNQAQHRIIADSLIPLVKQVTGWDTMPPVKISVPDPRSELVAGTNLLVTRTSMDKITLQSKFSGMKKEITVFDCIGRPLRKVVTDRQTISLTRDLSLPRGVYFIKTSVR
jgi:alpha-L-fucosidase 2